ncbi:17639_t:CDS:2, partial [Acaulospora colombiana]
ILAQSPGAEQSKELQAHNVEMLGECDSTYPLQKKYHSMEFLRDNPHLRSRSNIFGAIIRIRSSAVSGFQKFFQENEFFQIHTPIITSSDCEGGGEVFRLSTNKLQDAKDKPPEDCTASTRKQREDLFRAPVYLTVSGQLHAEMLACAMSRVFTFGPVFRAEASLTSRHLIEFWMLEAEVACLFKLEELLHFAERCIRETTRYILDNCTQEIEFFNQRMNEGLFARLENTINNPFSRLSYSEAIDVLSRANRNFEYTPKYGCSLQSEHEKYLATDYCCGP